MSINVFYRVFLYIRKIIQKDKNKQMIQNLDSIEQFQAIYKYT